MTLAFKDADLEKAFLEEYCRDATRTMLSYVPWAIFTVSLGFGVIIYVFPTLTNIYYLFAFTVSGLLFILFHFKGSPPSYRFLDLEFALLAILPGWLYAWLVIILETSSFQIYVFAIIAVHLVASSLAIPVRFATIVVALHLELSGVAVVFLYLGNLETSDALLQCMFLSGIASMCMYAAYQREKANRGNFFRQKLIEEREETIKLYSNALKKELDNGRKIQKDFLPSRIPIIPKCDIAAYFEPALQLSGDFYDVFTLPGNRVGLVIADVSDKGVGSALFMALLRSLIRVFSGHSQLHCSFENNTGRDSIALKDFHNSRGPEPIFPLNAVSLTNEYIAHEHGDEGMFATLFFGVLDPSSGSLTYINAGHEPLILVGVEGIKQRLKPTGPAVGMMPGSSYNKERAQFKPGEILLGYTDGVTEARSPLDKLYTRKRLEISAEKCPLVTAADFLENIKLNLFNFIERAPQSDDITMLAVRWG